MHKDQPDICQKNAGRALTTGIIYVMVAREKIMKRGKHIWDFYKEVKTATAEKR